MTEVSHLKNSQNHHIFLTISSQMTLIIMSDSKLSFPPAANFPQIKFGSASMLSLSTCCILRHVFICHLDQIHIFPYSLIV